MEKNPAHLGYYITELQLPIKFFGLICRFFVFFFYLKYISIYFVEFNDCNGIGNEMIMLNIMGKWKKING